jgi:hypothetical protein
MGHVVNDINLEIFTRNIVGELFNIVFLLKLNSVALVREQTIPTEQPPLVSEINANFYG